MLDHADGGKRHPSAPAAGGDDSRLAWADAFEPAAPGGGRETQCDEEQSVDPAQIADPPIAARGDECLKKRHAGTVDGFVVAERLGQRQPEDAESISHADAQMDGKGGRGPAAAPAAQPGVPMIVLAGKGADVRPCNTCHTLSGMGQPESANIRGLNAAYFTRQMQDFKSGARGGPRSAAMAGFAKNMSDDDIKEVATYYSGLKA